MSALENLRECTSAYDEHVAALVADASPLEPAVRDRIVGLLRGTP